MSTDLDIKEKDKLSVWNQTAGDTTGTNVLMYIIIIPLIEIPITVKQYYYYILGYINITIPLCNLTLLLRLCKKCFFIFYCSLWILLFIFVSIIQLSSEKSYSIFYIIYFIVIEVMLFLATCFPQVRARTWIVAVHYTSPASRVFHSLWIRSPN